jgi:hypothetical protein
MRKRFRPDGRFALLCPVRDEKSEHYSRICWVRLKPYGGIGKTEQGRRSV